MNQSSDAGEAKKLEELWAGDFGRAYIERNKNASNGRDQFWTQFLKKYPVRDVLEVGCNIGGNLRWIAGVLPPSQVHGIDVNAEAVRELASAVPGIQVRHAVARELPYPDGRFELVFTAGVLIHQPEEALSKVMTEIVRCSKRYVLALEYFAAETTEVFYRGQTGALFKRDYGRLYAERFPELRLIQKSVLGKSEGWDNVTVWLFIKTNG